MRERCIDDDCNIEGTRDLSDSWTGCTRFTTLDEQLPGGFSRSGGRLTKKQTTSRPDYLWPEIWKRETKMVTEKLDKARRLRFIYVIDPDDEEFKDIKKNARRKLEIPLPAAMPCKLQREKYRETCRTVEEH